MAYLNKCIVSEFSHLKSSDWKEFTKCMCLTHSNDFIFIITLLVGTKKKSPFHFLKIIIPDTTLPFVPSSW